MKDIDAATRSAIARVGNIIRVLAARSIPFTDSLLVEAYEWAIDRDGDVADLLQTDVGDSLVAAITGR